MLFENISIVIIGGTGFMGHRIIEQLNFISEGKLKIRVLIRDERKIEDRSNITKIIGSLPNVPPELFPSEPNIVIHFGTKNRDDDGSGFEEVNVTGTKNIMRLLPESTLGVIYGSSFSVYGQGNLCNIDETANKNPETPLAGTRSKAEDIIMEKMEIWGKSALVLRPRFIIAKDDKYTMPMLINAYKHHFNVGTGRQLSTYIEADDYAKIICQLVIDILLSARNNQFYRRALNIGYKRPISLSELNGLFADVFGHKTQHYIPVSKGFTDFLKAFPFRLVGKIATVLELSAFSHYADVSLLENIIGSEIVNKDPKKIINDLLRDKYCQNL